MKTFFQTLAIVAAVLLPSFTTRAASAADLDRASTSALARLYATNSEARMLGSNAQAVLVFPKIVKAGFMFGGAYGEGALLEDGYSIGYFSTAAASYGFQAGVQAYGYALFFMDDDGLSWLKRTRGFQVGAGPQITVLNKGFTKQLSSTSLSKGVYAVFFNQEGLMGGFGLQGSKILRIFPN